MSDKPENPPAFAVAATDLQEGTVFQEGMTLRDYFAATALQGMVAGGLIYKKATHLRGDNSDIAKWVYNLADAMLEARLA